MAEVVLIVGVSGLGMPTTEPSVEVPHVLTVGRLIPQAGMNPSWLGVSVSVALFVGMPLAPGDCRSV